MTNSTQVASNIRALGAFLCVALFVSAASATVCDGTGLALPGQAAEAAERPNHPIPAKSRAVALDVALSRPSGLPAGAHLDGDILTVTVQFPTGTVSRTTTGRPFDKDYLRRAVQGAREFQLRHNARIYVGEFSVAAWAPGADRYIADCADIFAEYGWDWTYHAFREYEAWSVEQDFPIPPVFGGKSTPSEDNPRKRALLNAIKGIRLASSRSDLDISESR